MIDICIPIFKNTKHTALKFAPHEQLETLYGAMALDLRNIDNRAMLDNIKIAYIEYDSL